MAALAVTITLVTLISVSTHAASSTPCTNCDGDDLVCEEGECVLRCINQTSSGECLQCLDSRFYGIQCEHDCPDTCLNSRCQTNNNRAVCTEGCVAGKKGDICGTNCSKACTQCERYGNGCTGPCQNPQYYGQNCTTPCPSNCACGCNRTTGECSSCEPGYAGTRCDVTCQGEDCHTGTTTALPGKSDGLETANFLLIVCFILTILCLAGALYTVKKIFKKLQETSFVDQQT